MNDALEIQEQQGSELKAEVKGVTQQFLTFLISGEEYGIGIKQIREIREATNTTRLPNQPSYNRGVINLRGAIIPIYDLKARYHIEQKTPHPAGPPVVEKAAITAEGNEMPGDEATCSTEASVEEAPPPPPKQDGVIIVVSVGKRSIGILVDAVSDIVEVTEAEVRPAPPTHSSISDEFIVGLISIDRRMITLLDPDELASIGKDKTHEQ